jgi:Bacterial SH3 domain
MKGKRSTGTNVVLVLAAWLVVVPVLSGCGGRVGEQSSSIAKSLSPAPTATALPPTVPPATVESIPTRVTPSPLPPSPTGTTRPTRTPIPTPSITPTPAPDAVVTADALNLRGGPDTVYSRLGTLRKGAPLTVTARSKAGDWLEVTTQGGENGWVAAAYVELNLPVESIPLAAEVPPTPVPPPTQPPTQQALAEDQPSPEPPTATPAPGPSVDDQIAAVNRGQHDQLPQLPMIRGVAAGGEAELTILNHTPYVLTVLIGSPNQTTITVEKCPTCSTYGTAGPPFCQEEGRPRQTIRIKPGTMKVAARVDNANVTPSSAVWTFSADSAYFYCFSLVTQ